MKKILILLIVILLTVILTSCKPTTITIEDIGEILKTTDTVNLTINSDVNFVNIYIAEYIDSGDTEELVIIETIASNWEISEDGYLWEVSDVDFSKDYCIKIVDTKTDGQDSEIHTVSNRFVIYNPNTDTIISYRCNQLTQPGVWWGLYVYEENVLTYTDSGWNDTYIVSELNETTSWGTLNPDFKDGIYTGQKGYIKLSNTGNVDLIPVSHDIVGSEYYDENNIAVYLINDNYRGITIDSPGLWHVTINEISVGPEILTPR